MGLSSLSLMLFSIYILSTIVKFHLVVANSLQSYTPPCSADEHSALLQFKQSFVINTSASSCYYDYGAYPKTLSWKSNRSCCSWDGITCDEETGHVIGLDLSGSCLYGSINSSSSIFRLVHLESLNLANNDFNSSQIPPTIRNFPRLRYLNFSYSGFSGRVPSEISHLSKLSSFSIERNYNDNQMFSHEGFLRSLAQNLTGLEKLHLSDIDISSSIPDTLANLSHLTSLVLENCSLSGKLPFSLSNLRHLFYLDLSLNNISGQTPPSFGNLTRLTDLWLGSNQLSGHIPASFGNLTRLTDLSLGSNQLSGPIPASFGNLTRLTNIWLGSNQLSGPIPASLGNLSRLTTLLLYSNQLSGPIPASLENLSRLTSLWLGSNNFNSSIPPSLFNLVNLRSLDLMDNNWNSTIEFHKFLKLQNLTDLWLSGNKLEVLMGSTSMNNTTTVVPKFENLILRGCNISEFPDFLRSQDSLRQLDLSGNRLHGGVPKWMWNMSTQTLGELVVSHNFLLGFDRPPSTIPWVNLEWLDLASNSLVGEISSLICNASTLNYVDLSDNRVSGVLPQCLRVSSNDLQYLNLGNNNSTGKVSPQICNLTKLSYLDLSSNKLSGMLPQCLGPSLEYLNLANNSFHGILPQRFTTAGCDLSMIDVSHNKLQGQLPRSLANCASLEFLVLSNNQFDDVFPLWLGTLQKLKILAMRHNRFYGVTGQPKKNLHFPELRILDLSYNSFRGKFPAEYIFSGYAIRGLSSVKSSYHSYDHYLQGKFVHTVCQL
uniref:receptor-like protein kinase 2 n=1 Tax=Fragaria vesca subsp. vesca TaxID=101020 RepID=UPI0005CA0B52|nr:PREDICTED: receptor-like protein kinase 2 [Fragaria vesca subsp. vesca]